MQKNLKKFFFLRPLNSRIGSIFLARACIQNKIIRSFISLASWLVHIDYFAKSLMNTNLFMRNYCLHLLQNKLRIKVFILKTGYNFGVFMAAVFLIISTQLAHAKFQARNRQYISMVGSSTVYPFAATIAETFGRDTEFKTPIVEATGTGGGFKLFCAGVGFEFPDFVNASRRITESERKKCTENGISVEEILIGYDGIILAHSTKDKRSSSSAPLNLAKKQIFLALSNQISANQNSASQDLERSKQLVTNYFKRWSEIDSTLPDSKITVYGPPTSSGTRDSFIELAIESECIKNPAFITNFKDEKLRKKKCQIIRFDGAFIEAGENDNLIIQKLISNHEALGIFGYSFLAENQHRIAAVKIDGVEPNMKTIASGEYSISRPLFIYAKKEHLELISGMKEFIEEIKSKNTIGVDGYLLQKGLVPVIESKKLQ